MVQYCTSLAQPQMYHQNSLLEQPKIQSVYVALLIRAAEISKQGLLRLSLNPLHKSLFLLILSYNFMLIKLMFVCFVSFSHPSWQPLLIKNWNLKNRNQVAAQYVNPIKKLSMISFFYHIFSSYTKFRKEICLLNNFLLENVGIKKRAFL